MGSSIKKIGGQHIHLFAIKRVNRNLHKVIVGQAKAKIGFIAKGIRNIREKVEKCVGVCVNKDISYLYCVSTAINTVLYLGIQCMLVIACIITFRYVVSISILDSLQGVLGNRNSY